MASTGLLAHSATIARDKLAEVLHTRERLWVALAQKDKAEATAKARTEFIASASHEIKTPLHQLQGYADLLAESELMEDDRRLLDTIQLATRSLTMITSNVLDWSRLESGEALCRPVPVDVRLACEAVLHVLPNKYKNTETELIVIVAPEVPRSVDIDETYLQRILVNLLSNSLKFTPSGYVMLLVRLTGGNLKVTVEDSGRGIPKSFLGQMFVPYKQVQARGAELGTGLGLSITKRLLERMGGTVAVASRYQLDLGVGVAHSGTAFALTIPVPTLEDSYPAPLGTLRVAIMHDGTHRDIEALVSGWTSYNIEVQHTNVAADVVNDPNTIIWADVRYLQRHRGVCTKLLKQRRNIVLVPYENSSTLLELLDSKSPTHVVPIRKPLIWHRIVQMIVDRRHARSTPDFNRRDDRVVPTASTVRISANIIRQQTSRARKRTILLVEDNKVNQTLGAKMLAKLDYAVLLAEDGQEAVDIMTQNSISHRSSPAATTIDAILMDQFMPRKDGITATQEIRQMRSLLHQPIIIAVTAAAGQEAQARFLRAGADTFLPKPMSLKKLEETLNEHFGTV